MRKYHFINLPELTSFYELWDTLKPLRDVWNTPSFQLSRITLKNSLISQKFLSMLPSSSIHPNRIILSLDSSFFLDTYLKNLIQPKNPIPTEIIVGNSKKQFDSLTIFLEDKYPELKFIIMPKFSLLYKTYELDYSINQNKKRKSRSTKPPRSFQNLIKKVIGTYYSQYIGTEYFGYNVFQTYRTLFINQINQISQENKEADHSIGRSDLNDWNEKKEIDELLFQNKVDLLQSLPYPPRSLKYNDYIHNNSDAITFLFQKHINEENFPPILQILDEIYQLDEKAIINLNLGIFLESWQTDMFYKSGSRDKYLISFWDPEIALKERNKDGLINENLSKNTPYQPNYHKIKPHTYFFITPLIQEDDFRLKLLKKAFNKPIFLR